MAVWGSKGTTARADEIYALARQVGFSTQDAITATAIALAESLHGVTNAWNPVPPDDSLGLWQINMLAHGQVFGDKDQLVNPQRNATAAYALSRAGANWYPWSTWTSGKYRQYLPEAQQAALNVQDDQIGAVVEGLLARAQQIPLPNNISGRPDPGPNTGAPVAPGLPSIGDIGQAASPFKSALDAIAAPFAWLTVPGHWWAIGLVALGAIVVVGGALLYFQPEAVQAMRGAVA